MGTCWGANALRTGTKQMVLMLFLFKITLAFVLIHQFPRAKFAHCALFLDLCFAQLTMMAAESGDQYF